MRNAVRTARHPSGPEARGGVQRAGRHGGMLLAKCWQIVPDVFLSPVTRRCRRPGRSGRNYIYSERMNLAQLPIAVGVRNVPLAVSRTGGPHAPLHLHPRRPRRDPPRALPPPPPPRAAEAGGPVAEEPGLHPRGHGTPPTPLAL